MEELKELVTKLERAYSGSLVSVVLYGSAASGQHNAKFSDLNVLCVLKQITPGNWWTASRCCAGGAAWVIHPLC